MEEDLKKIDVGKPEGKEIELVLHFTARIEEEREGYVLNLPNFFNEGDEVKINLEDNEFSESGNEEDK